MTDISVILPAYNADKTIGLSIESVLNQTFKKFEFIVVDDGSTDNTVNIVKSYNDNRIRTITINNSGPSKARNSGIKDSHGRYISFIDSDDLWAKDKLEKQIYILSRDEKYEVAYSWSLFIDENGKYIHPLKPVGFQGNVYQKMLINNFIGSGSNILVKREALESVGYFDEEIKYGEEWDLYIRLSRLYHFGLITEYQIYYRQNFGSLSTRVDLFESGSISVVEKAFIYDNNEEEKIKYHAISNIKLYSCYIIASRMIDESWKLKALIKIKDSLILNPYHIINPVIYYIFIIITLSYILPLRYSQRISKKILCIYGKAKLIFNNKLKNTVEINNL